MAIKYAVLGQGIVNNNRLLAQYLTVYQQQSAEIQRLTAKTSFKQAIKLAEKPDFILGWGRKKSYYKAKTVAKVLGVPVLTLEDGFLRSLDTGQASRYACSLVIDPIGIYFDSHQPSLLEKLIIKQNLTQDEEKHANYLINKIISQRLSKYNTTPKLGTLKALNLDKNQPNILLIDQVAGDQSISGAGATADTFTKMLKMACDTHPTATIWIKAHPAGKVGYLTEQILPNQVRLISHAVNPLELLEQMDEVYTVSSHMGFEALMLGKTVHCFGLAWYSGWGLTDDSYLKSACQMAYQQVWQRRGANKQPTLAAVFFACYCQYSQYANPATGQACQIEQVLDWLITNRHWREKLPKSMTAYHISFWKKGFVNQFVQLSNMDLFYKPRLEPRTMFDKNHLKFPKTHPFLVWGFAKKRQLVQKLHQPNTEIWCMEDGFIRSNGLGADLIEPLSVVLDKTGIYYNATEPSDLESLLKNFAQLNIEQNQRIERLKNTLLTNQVSKYNVGKTEKLQLTTEKTKILVVGQVEDDMSVKLCASDIKSNLALLKAVRADNPTAYIVYKPHPDVQAGLRLGKVSDDEMYEFADKMVLDAKIADCLAVVDEVHTISSLTGFEALLRGLSVTCYGLPFYAGWGLTNDKANNPTAQTAKNRRQRSQNLTLNQLIYAILIDYPLYRIPNGYGLAQVEDVIAFLYDYPSQNNQQKSKRSVFSQVRQTLKNTGKHKFMQTRQLVLQKLQRKQATDNV
ncbi:capsular polysaccharide biosynthesis protein [Faucicola boevrei]|uniref:capsular polysaccharide biosynthesis protein n=1 Tax=Faucicola boevrei TaxID=346665 RepID=UPI000369C041|nr:capsular polysaccharide biosynthesis protein [Moraxella boevrei]